MTEEKFIFGEQPFVYEKNETTWKLSLKRSDVASQDLRELLLLDLHHPFFLEQSMVSDEDSVCLLYTSPSPRDLSTSRMPSSA